MLIDIWMMTKRWKEEITQTYCEMKKYLESLTEIYSKLNEEVAIHTAIIDSWQVYSEFQVCTILLFQR